LRKKPERPLPASRRALLYVLAASLAWSPLAPAAISQQPLLAVEASVSPNLVFTLDDSGSMLWDCIPDSACTPWNYNSTNLTPQVDPFGYRYVGQLTDGSGAGTASQSYNLSVTTDPGNLYNRQLRSSQRNGLYYNPRVRYQPWRKADGSRYPQSPPQAAPTAPLSSATVDLTTTQTRSTRWCTALITYASDTGSSDINTVCPTSSQTFYPAVYHDFTGTDPGDPASYARVEIRGAGTTYPKAPARTDCAGSTCTLDEELQNFANWYTYHRSRLLTAIAGTAEAFFDTPADFRVGYGRISRTNPEPVDGVDTTTVMHGVRPFDATGRADFYGWLFQQSTSTGAGTPLRRALDGVGQYFMRSDSAGPWGAMPGSGTEPSSDHLGCRRSFHLLMTDGVWNGADAQTSVGDADNTAGPVIGGPGGQTYQYVPAAPYRSSATGNLADIAMYYWSRDLRPDLPNEVRPSQADPAFWQHLVNYTIGFGVTGNLRNPEDLPALAAGTLGWGTPSLNQENAADNVDDLWHAALNSRGKSISARNATEYAEAVKNIIADISTANRSEAGVEVSTRFLRTDSRVFVPSYRSGDWTGELAAEDPNHTPRRPVWKASAVLPAFAQRQIFTRGPAGGVAFQWADLQAAGLDAELGVSSGAGPGLVDYLRGDASQEGSLYRKRASRLGDIVNSRPLYVKDRLDAQYDYLPASHPGRSTYRTYLSRKRARVGQVFVGANDGMLHAFSEADGTETFAYVPRAVLGGLKNLASPTYSHRFFVDGPVVEADVHDGSGWKNLVLGTGGAGAKNLFAIGVPVPAAATSNPALQPPGVGDLRWEVDSATAGFEGLGHLLQAPEAGLLRDGRWAVVVGNGYETPGGKAQLFVIDALSGALIKRIDTGADGANGLGGVRLVLDDQQRIAAAYAGDLRGNLWKFDFSSTSASDWSVAFGGQPLFVATDAGGTTQPITAAPEYLRHPLGGVMLLAGTGRLFDAADPSNAQQQTLYGLWDKAAVGAASGTAAGFVIAADKSQLVSQSLSGPVDGLWTLSDNTVDYAARRGWYVPLARAGERVIYAPSVYQNSVTFSTLLPGAINATNACLAVPPKAAEFTFDPFSGGPRDQPTYDVNADGVFDSRDARNVAGIERGNAEGPGSIIFRGNGQGAQQSSDGSSPRNLGDGTVRKRWQYIVNPPV